jgi:hypothetical protein
MDQPNVILSYVTLAISLASIILGIINHRRIRSNCCGKVGTVSLDVDSTTPPTSVSLLNKNPPAP